MTAPIRTRVSVEIDAPAEVTWAQMVDWAGQGRWILATTVSVLRGTGTAVGDQVLAVTGVGGRGLRDVMEITEFVPPSRCGVRHIGSVVRGDGLFLVEPITAARSRMTWVDDVEPPLGAAGAWGWRLVGERFFRRGARASLRRFAVLAASGGTRTR